jgi:hypothetical protein
MTRRNILILASLFGLSSYLQGKSKPAPIKSIKEVENIIQAVQEHLFPVGNKIPSAKEMRSIIFLFDTINHKSYDKDIRQFVIEGAKEFDTFSKGKFVKLSKKQKEKKLREFENTNYGSSWISRIMTLTMEGLFSDPIYGSNINEAGWKALAAYGGVPRPNTRYIK